MFVLIIALFLHRIFCYLIEIKSIERIIKEFQDVRKTDLFPVIFLGKKEEENKQSKNRGNEL